MVTVQNMQLFQDVIILKIWKSVEYHTAEAFTCSRTVILDVFMLVFCQCDGDVLKSNAAASQGALCSGLVNVSFAETVRPSFRTARLRTPRKLPGSALPGDMTGQARIVETLPL